MKSQNLRTAARHAKAFDHSLSVIKTEDPVDVISNHLEKALNAERSFVKPAYEIDPVNAYVESAFSFKRFSDNPKHQVDEFYDSLKTELSNRRPFVKPSRPLDMVNAMAGKWFASNHASVISLQKLNGIFDRIKQIYRAIDGSTNAVDPINEMFYKPSMIASRHGKPKHTIEEVTSLIKESLGSAFKDIKPSFATDAINDVAAAVFGGSSPSAENLYLVENKLLAATYELVYKLTPGSSEYKNKTKEYESLKETRKQLQDNLKELERQS
jgi:hypothetical protein